MQSKALWVLLIILVLFAYTVDSYIPNEGQFRLDFLNVGQGDATLIRTPDGLLVLIDSGRANTLLAELKDVLRYNEREIELFIGTHPDADHVEGSLELFEYFEVKNIFWSGHSKSNSLVEQIQTVAATEGSNFTVNSDNGFRVGCCVYFDVVWPPLGEDLNVLDANDASITLLITYQNFDVFMGGDLSKEYELASLEFTDNRKVELLKVGHHGSSTSTSLELLDRISPHYAMISVGRDNSYGHPSTEVLDVLMERGVNVYRTDLLGRITVKVSEGEVSVISENLLE